MEDLLPFIMLLAVALPLLAILGGIVAYWYFFEKPRLSNRIRENRGEEHGNGKGGSANPQGE